MFSYFCMRVPHLPVRVTLSVYDGQGQQIKAVEELLFLPAAFSREPHLISCT